MAQTGSFIPQSNTPSTVGRRSRRRVYVLNYIVYTVFFGVLLTVAGLLVWEYQAEAKLDATKQALDAERSSFSQSDIARVRDLDMQLQLAAYIMDRQPALSKLLTALEETTLNNIQISDFVVTEADDSQGTVLVEFTGTADSFDAVLFQREVMKQNDILRNASTTNVTYSSSESASDEGSATAAGVTYEVTLAIPVRDIAYEGVPVVSVVEEVGTSTPDIIPLTETDTTVEETDSAEALFDEVLDTESDNEINP